MKKVFKTSLVTFISIILVFSLAGCSCSINKNLSSNESENESGQQQSSGEEQENIQENIPAGPDDEDETIGSQETDNKELQGGEEVKYQIITDNYPAEIDKYLQENKAKETQQAFNINNRTYLVLTMGQRSSAGYAIELKDLVLKDGALNVFVRYKEPSEVAAAVLTYPSLVIETDDIYEGHYEIIYNIEK